VKANWPFSLNYSLLRPDGSIDTDISTTQVGVEILQGQVRGKKKQLSPSVLFGFQPL
jgi:hypothetical protein